MSLLSWFNSADQVDTALVVVAMFGAVIEVGVAVAAVINVHKELEESRKAKLEKYIEVFACVAAFFFLAEAILGWRSSALLAKEVEKLKTDNLRLEAQIQPRRITAGQKEKLLALLSGRPEKKCAVLIAINSGDIEQRVFGRQLKEVLVACGFDASIREGLSIPNGAVEVPIDFGLRFVSSRVEPPPSCSLELIKALGTAGVIPETATLVKSPGPWVSDGILTIWVGTKPIE
jgi:hypothetical protein